MRGAEMADTPNTKLTLLEGAQAQKHITANEAFTRIDALLTGAVLSRDNTPPVSPGDGDRYLVGSSPTGDWAGQANAFAYYTNGGWGFVAAFEGLSVWDQASAVMRRYVGGAWTLGDAGAVGGAGTRTGTLFETVALTGAAVTTMTMIPERAMVLGVSTRVVTPLTGASNFDVGVAADDDRFGEQIGGNAGDVNQGGVTPYFNFTAEGVILTGRDSGGGVASFTGGSVAVAIHLLYLDAPA